MVGRAKEALGMNNQDTAVVVAVGVGVAVALCCLLTLFCIYFFEGGSSLQF